MYKWLKRLLNFRDTERHPLTMLFGLAGKPNTTAGVLIDEQSVNNITTAYACIRIISEDLASLSFPVYQRSPQGGRQRATEHPVYRLLNYAPNPEQSPMIFWETMVQWCLRTGNAFAEIERSRRGVPINLWALDPRRMTPKRDELGNLYYEYQNGNGKVARFEPNDIIHIRNIGDNILGWSPVRLHRDAFGLAAAMQQFGAAFFGNSARPGGIITHPQTLSQQASENLENSMYEKHGGPSNYGKWLVLEEGATAIPWSIPPEDAQFLASRKFQRTEICSIYRIAPHMVAELEHATYTNIEQQSLDYVRNTLRPWAVRIEEEVNRKLFTESESSTFFAEILLDSLLRADITARTNALAKQFSYGALTLPEWRAIENRNPIDNTDDHFVPNNIQTLTQALIPKTPGQPEVINLDPPDEPPEPDSTPDEPIEDRALIEVLNAEFARMVRRETKGICKLARKPKQFSVELEDFYQEHSRFALMAIEPAVRAYCAASNRIPDMTKIEAEIEQHRSALVELMSRVSEEELEDAVFALTSTWVDKDISLLFDR